MAPSMDISSPLDDAEKAKTLIGALNLISRNLPLPPDVFSAVSSIFFDEDGVDGDGEGKEAEAEEEEKGGDDTVMKDFEQEGGDSEDSVLILDVFSFFDCNLGFFMWSVGIGKKLGFDLIMIDVLFLELDLLVKSLEIILVCVGFVLIITELVGIDCWN